MKWASKLTGRVFWIRPTQFDISKRWGFWLFDLPLTDNIKQYRGLQGSIETCILSPWDWGAESIIQATFRCAEYLAIQLQILSLRPAFIEVQHLQGWWLCWDKFRHWDELLEVKVFSVFFPLFSIYSLCAVYNFFFVIFVWYHLPPFHQLSFVCCLLSRFWIFDGKIWWWMVLVCYT